MRNVLLSQGEARPGIVQGPHWGIPPWLRSRPKIDSTTHDSVGPGSIPVLIPPMQVWHITALPTPRSHADPRLSNRMER